MRAASQLNARSLGGRHTSMTDHMNPETSGDGVSAAPVRGGDHGDAVGEATHCRHGRS
jgi:hypothetical protein